MYEPSLLAWWNDDGTCGAMLFFREVDGEGAYGPRQLQEVSAATPDELQAAVDEAVAGRLLTDEDLAAIAAGGSDPGNYVPTPAEIAAATARLQAGWTEAEKIERAKGSLHGAVGARSRGPRYRPPREHWRPREVRVHLSGASAAEFELRELKP